MFIQSGVVVPFLLLAHSTHDPGKWSEIIAQNGFINIFEHGKAIESATKRVWAFSTRAHAQNLKHELKTENSMSPQDERRVECVQRSPADVIV